VSTPDPHRVTDVETLERLYGTASAGAIAEEVGHVHPVYRALIEASPFVVLATSGNPDSRVERGTLPSVGAILAAFGKRRLGGDDNDRGEPERLRETLY
jgi:hypothetical protein